MKFFASATVFFLTAYRQVGSIIPTTVAALPLPWGGGEGNAGIYQIVAGAKNALQNHGQLYAVTMLF